MDTAKRDVRNVVSPLAPDSTAFHFLRQSIDRSFSFFLVERSPVSEKEEIVLDCVDSKAYCRKKNEEYYENYGDGDVSLDHFVWIYIKCFNQTNKRNLLKKKCNAQMRGKDITRAQDSDSPGSRGVELQVPQNTYMWRALRKKYVHDKEVEMEQGTRKEGKKKSAQSITIYHPDHSGPSHVINQCLKKRWVQVVEVAGRIRFNLTGTGAV
ncbi:hypothetical protein ACO22_00205 [Paracoccidioides brasiliensis]|uniref:Uncharacterized protein n=1 Tax=Paracoccidioides brasiliensis TaxID=121759 RepID=A0A1D2JQ55_PARBR|nr:hypothetical protein ACO22_00205 [Paracoccidioides brasiliensis]